MYFTYNRGAYPAYKEVLEYVARSPAKEVGLFVGGGVYQYPILAEYYKLKSFEFITLLEDNKLDSGLNKSFDPDIIVGMEKPLDCERVYFCNGNGYHCVYTCEKDKTYTVWERNI